MSVWNLAKKLLLGAAAAGLGYGIYRATRPYFLKTLTAPPPVDRGLGARGEALITRSAGPWSVYAMVEPENGLRVPGKRYMASIRSRTDEADAIVEGTWKGDASTNRLAGALRVDRVVKGGKVQPKVPFELAIPASKTTLNNDYLQETRWRPLHPTSVGESPREGGRPKVDTVVRYALREGNPLGNLVVVLEGRVLDPTSSYWPEDEGEPDEGRVLVAADDIVRTVRGEGGEVRLPPAFVVAVEDLIAPSTENDSGSVLGSRGRASRTSTVTGSS
jgi:hypothetical protein